MSRKVLFSVVLFGVFLVNQLWAQEVYYYVPLTDLEFMDAQLPDASDPDETSRTLGFRDRRSKEQFMAPYAKGSHAEEIYLNFGPSEGRRTWAIRTSLSQNIANTFIAIHTTQQGPVQGQLFLPNPDWSKMIAYPFKISKTPANQQKAHNQFLRAKEQHYRALLEQNTPGAAWFQYQITQARTEQDPNANTTEANPRRPRNRTSDLERTFALFSGGRALSENLQLDRELFVRSGAESNIAVDSLDGISVAAIDWKPIVRGLTPDKDPLAQFIPADQHALFFPSFEAMTTLVDEAKAHGTPILRLMDTRSEDALTHERYEKQLCLSLDAWARLLGPKLIHSIAMTGSDPYLRTGSDVAIVFETANTLALNTSILTQYGLVQSQNPQVKSASGALLDVTYAGVISSDRSVCSYTVTLDKTVIVTNSLAQLKAIIKTHQGATESLASLDEYTFFRDRYKRSDPETALLVITDAAIRRWCGPQWRISTSRRVRAASVLAQLQAAHLDRLAAGVNESTLSSETSPPSELGTVNLTPSGIHSSRYGTLEFQTPISEMNITQVTQAESQAYARYRDRYQKNWAQFFDPIAIRFTVLPAPENRIAMDLTVRPLIASTEYQKFIEIAGNQAITPQAGDPHPEALAQFILSIDRKAMQIRQYEQFAAMMIPSMKASPLGWLGEWGTVYADQDPFWQALQPVLAKGQDEQTWKFMEENLFRLPVAVQLDIGSSLKFTGFLIGARAFIEQTVPNMTVWETLQYRGQAYVKVSPSEQTRSQAEVLNELALYYAMSPDAFILSLNESMIKRFIDRRQSTHADPKQKQDLAWLGQSVGLKIEGQAVTLLQSLFDHNMTSVLRSRSWGNLAILNEWHQRHSDFSSVEFHQRFWQTKLVCPGGGQYVWNETCQTMESTVFGCPAQPTQSPDINNALTRLKDLNMGLTFEDNGLRVRAAIKR